MNETRFEMGPWEIRLASFLLYALGPLLMVTVTAMITTGGT